MADSMSIEAASATTESVPAADTTSVAMEVDAIAPEVVDLSAPTADETPDASNVATDADSTAPGVTTSVAPAAPSKPSPVTALTPEIRWHCGPTGLNEAVLSIDFLHAQQVALPSPSDEAPIASASSSTTADAATPITLTSTPTILATGGADKEIKLWRVHTDLDHPTDSAAGLEFIFSLSGHDRSVNCVRFSPDGTYLASASDDSTIILWTKPKTAAADWHWGSIASFSDVSRTLLACGHKGDITDLAWSPDSLFLCSTSVDNSCVIWNAERGDVEERRKDHLQYVQGAAWDPLNEFLATAGNDRSCRVYALQGFDASTSRRSGSGSATKKNAKKCVCVQTLKTREFAPRSTDATLSPTSVTATPSVPIPVESLPPPPPAPKHRMFLDDTCPAFARRPAWTPDGRFVLFPTGVFQATEASPSINTVYAFARGHLAAPALHLPGHDKAPVGIRCSPRLYALRPDTASNLFQMPQRAVFAVVTLNAVAIYDTQQRHPLVTLKDLHYADLTDATWSADGQRLAIASMDGYVTFITFMDDFFGDAIPLAEQAAMNAQQMQRMFAAPKLARKKLKATATDASADGGTTTTTTAAAAAGAKKKTPKIALLVARKKTTDAKTIAKAGGGPAAPVEATPNAVHTLQVRKKRKIAPVLVTQSGVASVVTSVAATDDVAIANDSEKSEQSVTEL